MSKIVSIRLEDDDLEMIQAVTDEIKGIMFRDMNRSDVLRYCLRIYYKNLKDTKSGLT